VPSIELCPGAEENGLATMLATLIAQNLEDDPSKQSAFDRLAGRVAIVAVDAGVALTLEFAHGRARVHDGIVGIPDLTIRGGFEQIGDMSRMESIGKLPDPRGEVNRAMVRALRDGQLRIFGLPRALGLLYRMGEVLAVH
jgi:hypothetical protein